ncbi:MAG TPA: cytochrome b N-terminal domain-containing protein [Thermoanaerobaculales bacterium]|nr:cytochrome b N-terminal domain-containing protein [Thermoanaerobaculales bacterium]HQP42507.1 cytochrome b N-terminal domain-containing protein [Thermoanaerobaculales bacterium]
MTVEAGGSKVSEPARAGLGRRVVRSIFPESPVPRSDRDRARVTRFTFLLHLRPVLVPARTVRWAHTCGLGGSSLVLVAILALTGTLMMLVYQPAPGAAYDSVVTMETGVAFGSLVRGVHWWSANLLVIVVLLHLCRVFLTGGFHGPRQFNWVIGAGLLMAVLANNFTGYLLPWDQLSYWAVTISTGMLGYVPGIGGMLQRVVRGGAEIGPETMINFFTVHTTIVPIVLIVLMGFHFWRVRRAGGVVPPPAEPGHTSDPGDKVHFLPHLLVREVSQALVIAAAVVVLGALFGAPLGERANPGMSPNPAKAPWYFMGFQELLIHLHPTFAVLVIPLGALLGFLLLPYLTSDDDVAGSWFLSRTGRRTAALAGGLAIIATPVLVLLDEAIPGAPGWLLGGLLPFAALAAALVGVARLMRRRHGASINETAQAVVVLVAVAFAVLTLIGVWFRGEGMALVWPWAR